MSVEHSAPVASRVGTIALMAMALMGLAKSPLEAEILQSLPATRIIVTTTAELEAALSPSHGGVEILVRAGEYDVSQALTIPDNTTLVGEGIMNFDESGLPTGFEPSGRTLLRSTAALVGDILTLGNGAAVRNLAIEDLPGRQGNLVAVHSRSAGDFVSARIDECEIINPNPAIIIPQGSAGRGLAVITRNLNQELDPPPDEGAVLQVQMVSSIVRSPAAGYGVFAINFASHAEIKLVLIGNVIGGGVNASGGVSRPDAVTGASVTIQSARNQYRSDSLVPTGVGWSLIGGTTAPGFVGQASTFNSLELHSVDDRIEGFASGITARAGLRMNLLSEPSSSNRIEMSLLGTSLQTTTADLRLFGAQSAVAGVSAGDDSSLHLVIHQAIGSGPRANAYADSLGNFGTGNRLEIVGNANAFAQANKNIVPPPSAEFFTAQP